MSLELQSRSVQFFSLSFTHPEQEVVWTGETAQGRDISVSGKLRIGTPLLLRDILPNTKVRPLYALPWPDYPSIGAVQFVDPYAERRWPSYMLLEARLALPTEAYSKEVAQDVLQYLRGIIARGLLDQLPLDSLLGQRVSVPGYRWGYWTPMLDFVGNPSPNPYGGYAYSEPGEAIGPGFTSVENYLGFPQFGVPPLEGTGQLPDLSKIWNFMAQLHLALVWSQAFSLPNRTTAGADHDRIKKRVQEIRMHWNSYNELNDAEGHLTRHDAKGAVRSAASAVDAALRFFCAEWGTSFPTDPIPFDEKIERILADSGRPSYRAANRDGSRDVLHLYRARSKMHEGDVYYTDEQTKAEVRVDMSIAKVLVQEAETFLLWLDSQT
jgi:hypothetical protein